MAQYPLFPLPPAAPERRRVADLPAVDRPFERLASVGLANLALAEVLALVLQTADALDLARDVLATADMAGGLLKATAAQLKTVPGVGAATAVRVIAAAELGRRVAAAPDQPRPVIASPADAVRLLAPLMAHLEQEHLRVMLLDGRSQVMGLPVVYIGNVSSAIVRIGEVLRPAVIHNAPAVLIAHNHPSGDPSPSPEDVMMTRQLVIAGRNLDVDVVDHLVITRRGFVSLRERGLGFDEGGGR